MIRKVIIHDTAFQDLDENSAYISGDNPRASVEFLEAAREAFQLIAEWPGVGAPRDYDNPDYSGMRMWPIRRFRNYLIYYVTSDHTVEIVRVLHGSQNIQSIFAPKSRE